MEREPGAWLQDLRKILWQMELNCREPVSGEVMEGCKRCKGRLVEIKQAAPSQYNRKSCHSAFRKKKKKEFHVSYVYYLS